MKLETAIQSTLFQSQKQKAGLNILYSAWWLKTVVSKELKNFGLTHEQFNVLRILKGRQPEVMCVRDIACRMIEKSSNVPRIIDRLEAKKLVNRSTSLTDKRETAISVTDQGLAILELASKKVEALFEQLITLGEEEALALNNLLEKYREKE